MRTQQDAKAVQVQFHILSTIQPTEVRLYIKLSRNLENFFHCNITLEAIFVYKTQGILY